MEQIINQDLNPLKLLFQTNSGSDGLPEKITDFFPAIIYIYDTDSKKLKYINRKITDMLGYSHSDVVSWDDDLMNIVYKDDLELVKKELDKFHSLNDNETSSYNARFVHKEGDWRYFRTQGTVLDRDRKGNAASLLLIAQDITDEVIAGSKFKRIEELFNDTQEVLKFGVWEWDVPENKINWSNGLYKLLGYDPVIDKEQLTITPQFYLQHIVEEDRPKALQNQPDGLIHHEYDHYYKVRDRNGRIKDVREKARVIRNEKDELLRVIGSTMDVTEQFQLYRDLAAYKAMKQENEQFLSYGTWEYDAAGEAYFWSDGMYRLFGYDPNTEKSKVLVTESLYRKHMKEEDYAKSRLIQESILKDRQEHYSWEYQIVANGGQVKIIEAMGKLLFDADGIWLKTIGTCRDVTPLRQYQLSLEEKVKDLDRSNKELEEFAYVASHDMNEPLRKITTFIERLENKYKSELGQDGQLYLTRISASVENMRSLIDTLLEFSRTARSNQPYVPVDLNKILAQVKADLDMKIEETGAMVIAHDLPTVAAVPSQMKQLFDNLLNNSIKFRRTGVAPQITVSGHRLTKKQKEQWHLDSDKQYVKIEFADNGIGFEPEYKERIFQIFQRLHGKSEYPGSGIGLAICKKIVDQHKGVIYATSEPENGATFTVIIPESQQ